MPNFMTSLPARGLLFCLSVFAGEALSSLGQFRAAEGGLHWRYEWLVLRTVSRCRGRDHPHRDPMPTFTPHQDSALKAVADWLKAKPGRNGTPPIFRLFGYAGTRKN